jgi:gas vesicle protein
MIETFFIGGGIGIVVGIVASLVALKIQQRVLDKTRSQQQAWEHAQQAQQQQREAQLEKRIQELEQQLDAQVQQLHTEWKTWTVKEATRAQTVAQEYASATARASREHEVAVLPHVDWIPATSRGQSQADHSPSHWRPAQLQGTDLSHRDLSQRYLGQANLRDAHLVNTNFYMSNLAGACLAGANLTGANLIGANLIGADLSGATLTGANVLVADLNDALLSGANLVGVRNLTVQQVSSAQYTATTQFDEEIALALSRTSPEERPTPPLLSTSTDQERSMPKTEAVPNAVPPGIAVPATPHPPSLPDTAPVISQSVQQIPLTSSPLPSNDSLCVPVESGLPADRPENTGTEEPDTNPPKRRGNGRK